MMENARLASILSCKLFCVQQCQKKNLCQAVRQDKLIFVIGKVSLRQKESIILILKLVSMQRKQNLKKSRKAEQLKGCLICKIARIPFLITMSSVTLLTKYYRPLEKSTYAAILQPLLRPASNRLRIQYREVLYLTRREENLKEYNSFSAVIGKIKPVVLERIRKDKLLPMHYHGQSHRIMLIHSLLTRKIKSIKLQQPKKQEITASTDQDHIQAKRPVLCSQKVINFQPNETVSMRRLTRSLSAMVQKFQEQCDFHSSFIFDLMNLASRHAVDYTFEDQQELFKIELENNNISEIKSKREVQRLPTNPEAISRKFQENYGFQPRKKMITEEYTYKITEKKRMKSPNMAKMMMKQNIPQRIQTDYDPQVIKKSKKKSSISSSKHDNDKLSRKFLGSMSKKKDNKVTSAAKSRIKC